MDNPLTDIDERQAVAMLEQLASFARPIVGKRTVAPKADGGEASRGWQPDLRYRSLVEKFPVVTFMASLDETHQELYVSPQIESLLGFSQDEWIGNPVLWFRQLHPEDRDRWVAEFARTCATGANFRAEYRLLARDGRIVWVQGECQLIRGDDGRPAFLQGIAFDITHLKKAAQVEEARLAAEAANAAKSEFLARMSHEIRTPLNGVVGMIDLLSATGMTDIQQRYTQLAREAADALLRVINDILDFSKIEAGKVEIENVDFDLHKLIEDLTELLAPVAAKKNLILASFIRPDLPRGCSGDPNRIRQVLTNLINNALKFTAKGSVGIRASLERADGEDFHVRIDVKDSGIGIPKDRIDRLFKSFSQVDSSTTRKYGGTGLGLAISKQLIELMGGEIGVTSAAGEGSTFSFTLKLSAAKSDDLGPATPREEMASVPILVAEADAMQRKILTEQIDGLFSQTSAVIPPEQVVASLRQAAKENRPFAAALLPFGQGITQSLIASIKNDPALSSIKLIAVQEIDDATAADIVRSWGFEAELHRPLTQSRMLDTVATATSHRAADKKDATVDSKSSRQPLNGLHLLVAEDNEMNQFVTREILKMVGVTCDVAGNGEESLEALAKNRYDGILMDCQMPGMDGLEASRRIRQHETDTASGRIPIIALTAEAIHGDREKCLAAGMDGYVTKPINPDELFAAIGELVVSARSAPAQTEVSAAPLPPPIDFDTLLNRCLNDREFAIKTLEKFQNRAQADVQLLRAYIDSGDTAGIRRLAHNLKSVAAHVAASPLREIVEQIELQSSQDEATFLAAKLAELTTEAERCSAYIQQITSNETAPAAAR